MDVTADDLQLAAPLEFRTAFNRYGGYCIPLSSTHRPASKAVLRGKVWEPDTVALLVEACAVREIVHAGTFFGDFLPAIAAAAKRVWAFEPSLENYRCASLTISLNKLGNVELARAALTDTDGRVRLQTRTLTGEHLGGGSRVVRMPSLGLAIDESSPGVVLDQAVPATADIAVIQLDVEGHEREALSGGLATIRRRRPILVVETVPSVAWIREHLAPLGYRLDRRLHNNTVFLPA